MSKRDESGERRRTGAYGPYNHESLSYPFPVRVDKAVFESPFGWAIEIRHERNIGDFTRWKDHDECQKAFTRLLKDLRAQELRQ